MSGLDMAQLYSDTSAQLVSYFAHRLSPSQQHMAEDLTMTTFEKAIRASERFEQRGVSPRSWLFTIASRVLIDQYRESDVRRRKGEVTALDALEHPEHAVTMAVRDVDLDAAADRLTLGGLVDSLVPEQRAAIRLWFYEGHGLASAGAALGTTPEGVKKRKARALSNLRKMLEVA